MALFQNSVINKHLKNQDQSNLVSQWNVFKNHFQNPIIQDNIRNSKEEQYQGEFLIDLFVNVLGYTKNPTPDFNLTTEYKNVKDSKKADGAIIVSDAVKAVIELKGTNTTDLGKIEVQAFGYKNNQPECIYVITSNFEKLRFYIDNATEHLEFNLFKLTEKEFELLYLCLAYENIKKDIPKKIKEDSVSQEDVITKKLYKDYSLFKSDLYANLVLLNPDYDSIELFKKSQKLLDRFLFIFFAEDRNLLPTNLIFRINKEWEQLRQMRIDVSLYDRYKTYFHDLNEGAKVTLPAFSQTATNQKEEHQIYAYNGGLFKSDAVLDNIKIDDAVLFQHTEKLSHYDFQSEVDVNILGHIFENSLNEFDLIKAQLQGETVDKTKTKRKKDGVFYTPKYITKYIVDNTVGKLCTDKKIALKIVEEEYTIDKKRQKKTMQQLVAKLTDYRNWLLQLTICDPACGSGAFLNQALDFLIAEHRYIDELQAKLFGDALVLSDIEKSILENNLFGVDLNEESVEIAKLSLWLRTAQTNRKLNDLNHNIKQGNSLIDDVSVAGENAFHWESEFPKVFAKGGFDVVIGNPPYVNANDIKKHSTISEYTFLKANYITAKGTVDLYIYFFEKGLNILNERGILSYITPNRFLSASYGTALREHIIFQFKLNSIIDYSDTNVFPDASTYPVITTITQKIETPYNIITGKFDEISKQLISKTFPSSKLNLLDDFILGFLLNDKLAITEKIIRGSVSLTNVGKINATSTAKEADDYSSLINETSGYKLINTGTIDPYITTWGTDFLTDKGKKYLHPYLPNKNQLISKNRHALYSSPKILISKIGLKCEAFYDSDGIYASINTNCIHSFEKAFIAEYVLCWLNSKLYNYMFECLFDGLRMSGGYLLFSAPNLKNTNIKKISTVNQLKFVDLANNKKNRTVLLISESQKFQRTIQRKFNFEDLPKKLQDWYLLTYTDFIKELAKKKVKLSLAEEAEWEDYFNIEASKALQLKQSINATDIEIDAMVYELYGLTAEEIKIVENG